MAKHLLSRDGHLLSKDGHLLSADESSGDPCGCCEGGCMCPPGLASSYTISGHIKVVDDFAGTICDTDFAMVAVPDAPGEQCFWRAIQQVCDPIYLPEMEFELGGPGTGPGGVCVWNLLDIGTTGVLVSKTDGPPVTDPTGAYPNIHHYDGVARTFDITGIVVS